MPDNYTLAMGEMLPPPPAPRGSPAAMTRRQLCPHGHGDEAYATSPLTCIAHRVPLVPMFVLPITAAAHAERREAVARALYGRWYSAGENALDYDYDTTGRNEARGWADLTLAALGLTDR